MWYSPSGVQIRIVFALAFGFILVFIDSIRRVTVLLATCSEPTSSFPSLHKPPISYIAGRNIFS